MEFLAGTKVEFAKPSSAWILSRKLDDNGPFRASLSQASPPVVVEDVDEERFVFLCYRDVSPAKEWAVMKIVMLYVMVLSDT